MSTNGGKTWRKSCEGLSFASDRGLTLNRIWQVVPDRPSRPETMWCGVDPGALFRSDDGGRNWYEVEGLNRHRTRDRWQPGGGGLMVHGIFPDPARENRIYVAISAAGCFRSDDDGRTWLPRNKDVLADFLPKPFPEVGQCVHHMVMNPRNPDQLFQQNHCGVYRSRNGGANWEDISEGLPSRFGFPMAAHPHEPETLFVVPEVGPEARYVCDGRLTVYRTKNGGKAWRKLTRGLPQKNAYIQVLRHAMQTDTCDNPAVYFGTTSGELYYSLNNGDSWQLLQAHLPRIYSVEAGGGVKGRKQPVAWNPSVRFRVSLVLYKKTAEPNRGFCATRYSKPTCRGIIRGGHKWRHSPCMRWGLPMYTHIPAHRDMCATREDGGINPPLRPEK